VLSLLCGGGQLQEVLAREDKGKKKWLKEKNENVLWI